MMEVINAIEYGNRDTLHAMLLFYMLSGMANCDAIHWYEGVSQACFIRKRILPAKG